MAKIRDKTETSFALDPIVTVRITKLGDGKVSNGRHHPAGGDEYYEWKEEAALPLSVAQRLETQGFAEIEGNAAPGKLPDGVDARGGPLIAEAEMNGPAYLQAVAASVAQEKARVEAEVAEDVVEPEPNPAPEPPAPVEPFGGEGDHDGDGKPGGDAAAAPKNKGGRPRKNP